MTSAGDPTTSSTRQAGRSSWSTPWPSAADVAALAWPVVGTSRRRSPALSRFERNGRSAKITNAAGGLRTTVEISLPGDGRCRGALDDHRGEPGETARSLKVVPYLEWVLNRPEADRGHTQYNRLFAEMEYVGGLHAVLAGDKHAKAMGVLASDHAPEGFLTSRIDFIGRARSLWTPRVLETLAFSEPRDTPPHPDHGPDRQPAHRHDRPRQGALPDPPPDRVCRRSERAVELVARHLQVGDPGSHRLPMPRGTVHPIGHGEIPPEVNATLHRVRG